MQRPTSAQPYGRPGDSESWGSPTQPATPRQDETCAEQNIVFSSSPVSYDSSTDITTPCRRTIARQPSTPTRSDLSIVPTTPDFLRNKEEHHEQAVAPLHSTPSADDLSSVPDTPPSPRGEQRLAPLSLVSTSSSATPTDPPALAEQHNDTSTTTAPLNRLPHKHNNKSASSVPAAPVASSPAQATSISSTSSTLNVSSTALASWSLNGQVEGLTMMLTWAPKMRQAFIKLRLTVPFTAAGRGQPKGASFYIFIAPERVTHLGLNTSTHKPLGPDTVLLVFQCYTPPDFVFPTEEHEYTVQDNARIHLFRWMTHRRHFSIYTAFKPSQMPVSLLRQFCIAVTERRLSTFPAQANIKRLYQGKGGRVVEGSDLPPPQSAASDDDNDDDDDGVASPEFDLRAVKSYPPAYEADTGSPAHASENAKFSPSLFSHAKHSRKRRHSETTDSAASANPVAKLDPSQPVDLATVTLLLDAHKRAVSDMFAKQQFDLKKQIDDLVRARLDELQRKVMQEIEMQQNAYENSALHEHVQKLFAEYYGDVRDCVRETMATQVFTARFGFLDP